MKRQIVLKSPLVENVCTIGPGPLMGGGGA